MPLNVNVNVTDAVNGLHNLQKDQIPFTLARSLTATAKDEQQLVQDSLPGRFTLRNRFTQQGIRITPAQKNSSPIQAEVYTYTANEKTGAPDYLLGQEDGAEKIPHNGRAHIAVPTRYLRQMAPGIIPDELRPKNLMQIADSGKFTSRRGNTRNARLVRGFSFFLQTMHDGHAAIMGRYMTDRDAYPFYLLIPEATIKPVLGMAALIKQTAQANFIKNWRAVWKDVLAKGLRVRF
jgi:hypothetical protein